MTTTARTKQSAYGVQVLGIKDVARLCGVAANTASRWIDSGQIEGYRLPGRRRGARTSCRRCTRAAVLRFLRGAGMPVPAELLAGEDEEARQAEAPLPAPPPPKPRKPGVRGAARTPGVREKDLALTTGDVARLCNVAPRTVTKWADAGRLPCWRLPGSNDRRFDPRAVERFMRAAGFPLPAELRTPVLLLVGGNGPALAGVCVEGWRVLRVPTLFAAGMAARDAAAVLYDFSLGRGDCLAAARTLRAACEADGLPRPTLLCVPADDEAEPGVLAALFDAVVSPGCDVGQILEATR